MRTFEWPTWLLIGVIYATWLGLTFVAARWPWWVVLPLGAFVIAWHGSLQHEAVHGHPTRSPRVNALLAGWPLWLWLPYGLYRESHLKHHASEALTDPVRDPESYYVTADAWAAAAPVTRAFLRAHNTLLGRLVLGPLVACWRLAESEARRLRAGDRSSLRHWAWHAIGVIAVLWWVVGVCGLSIGAYVALFAYPGVGLTLLRSFAEHRPHAEPGARTVIVESGPMFSLLFLNNNLHAVHHEQPHLPWYALPAVWTRDRADVLARNGGYLVGGYLEWARRFGLRVKDEPRHR